MFHIALAVMKHETTLLYPFVSMRDVLHKACTVSKYSDTATSLSEVFPVGKGLKKVLDPGLSDVDPGFH